MGKTEKTNRNYLESFNLTERQREYRECGRGWYYETPSTNAIEYMVEDDRLDYVDTQVDPPTEAEMDLLHSLLYVLTPKQRKVYDLHIQGLTQQQIADRLGVCQATVQLSMYGRYDYKYKKRYGGIIHKLKLALSRKEIAEIVVKTVKEVKMKKQVSQQVRISENNYKQLNEMALDLGLKRTQLLNVAIGMLIAMKKNKATGFKVVSEDKELEMLLPVDMTK